MFPITLETIVDIIGAEVSGSLSREPVTLIETDTRKPLKNAVFWGLAGDRFNGSAFASHALEQDAIAAVVDSSVRETAPPEGAALLFVEDTRVALQTFAAWYRRQLTCPMVAITGSVGKTTITAMTEAALQGCYDQVRRTYKNFNGQIGLPLSLVRFQGNEDVGILECGISAPGEMDRLVEMAYPDVAVVANAGPVHLEELGTIDRVAEEKLKLAFRAKPDAVVVLNQDDPRLIKARETVNRKVVSFGLTKEADVHPIDEITHQADGLRFTCNLSSKTVYVPISGNFQAINALAAIAIVHALGQDVDRAIETLQHFHLESMRMERLELGRGMTVLMDAYNSSPPSLRAAVSTLVEVAGSRRSVAILGDMLELGTESARFHEETARAVAKSGVDAIYFTGKQSEAFRKGLVGFTGEQSTFPEVESLTQALPHLLEAGDFVLIKASRGLRFERVLQFLRERFA